MGFRRLTGKLLNVGARIADRGVTEIFGEDSTVTNVARVITAPIKDVSCSMSASSLRDGDIIIGVHGRGYAGKSHFINTAVGKRVLGLKPARLATPIYDGIQLLWVCEEFDWGRVVFAELPFDFSHMDDIIEEYEAILRKSPLMHREFFGIIYLQTVEDMVDKDQNFPISPISQLNDLRRLFGKVGMSFPTRIIYASTKRESSYDRDAEDAETKLKKYYKVLARLGCIAPQVMRFTNSHQSAWDIVNELADMEPNGWPEDLDDILETLAAKDTSQINFEQLTDKHAPCVIDFLSLVLDVDNLLPQEQFPRILNLLSELAASYQKLPQSLMLSNVSYDRNEPFAEGGFGFVYKGTHKGQDVCIKAARSSALDQQEARHNPIMKAHIKELIMLAHMAIPYTLPLYGFYRPKEAPHQIGTVLSWMPGADLSTYIERNPGCHLILLAMDIAEGLLALHDRFNIVHGDLKATNVLITLVGKAPQAMIADFGISQFAKTSATTGKFIGSAYWMAPEQLVKGHGPSKEADIWALGCTFYELLTGNMPFSEYDTVPQLIAAMICRSARLEKPQLAGDSELLWSIMSKCLDFEPSKRQGLQKTVDVLVDLWRQRGLRDVRSTTMSDLLSLLQKAKQSRSTVEIETATTFAALHRLAKL